MTTERRADLAYATLVARLILGLIFFMAGYWKVFSLGPIEHARRLFVEPYAHTFLPQWALWATGTVTPFVEFAAGALVILGLFARQAYVALGCVLVAVTFGHLVAKPLYEFHTHVMPRTALLLFLLCMPRTLDRWSADAWRAARRRRQSTE